jgi:hypothetical protein
MLAPSPDATRARCNSRKTMSIKPRRARPKIHLYLSVPGRIALRPSEERRPQKKDGGIETRSSQDIKEMT